MKNTTIISALLLSIASIGMSQNNSADADNREKLIFGLKGGLNYSDVYDAQGEEFKADPKYGFAGGVFLEIPIGKYIGIQAEGLLSHKGFQASGRLLGTSYNFTRTTTYIDFPLQFALKPVEFITLLAGPQYSYLINQRDVFSNSTVSFAQEEEFKQDNISKNIFGVVGGLDINIKHIVLGGRAGWDIQNNNGDGTSSTPRYKNAWFQGTIGYKFFN